LSNETNDFSKSTLIYLDIFLKIPLLGYRPDIARPDFCHKIIEFNSDI